MGLPKKHWLAEEETALKAGVIKHGPGRWRNILLDPEFTSALKARSNVDLKDKWRNISVLSLLGRSRNKARLAHRTPNRRDDNSTALTIVAMANGVRGRRRRIGPASPPVSSEPPQDFKEVFTSVDKVILEAFTKLDRPLGLDAKSIVLYTEENCIMQPNMKRLVNSRLKHLIDVGTLVKIKRKYMISPNHAAAVANQSSPLLEGNKENTPKPEENGVKVDGGLLKIQGMTAQEAAVVAARAVAEAEFARAEAEQAAREADEAEAQAEAALIFAKVAMHALKQSLQSQTR